MHNNQCKIKAQELVPIDLFFDNWKKIFNVEFHLPETIKTEAIEKMREIVQPGKRRTEIYIKEQAQTFKIQTKKKSKIDFETIEQLLKYEITTKVHI